LRESARRSSSGVTRALAALAAGNEHVFPAVVGERLAGKAAVERLQLETGYVKEPEPLVPGRPPEGAPRAFVERDVDPVVAD
jgi:hypothetical protein